MQSFNENIRNSTLIVLPVFNEAKFLRSLFLEIKQFQSYLAILIVYDCSTDGSRQIIEELDAYSLRHDLNRGKGGALKTAFLFARKHRFEWVITLDADFQHHPRFIQNFINLQANDHLDLILGNRKDRDTMPFARQLSNGITSVVLSILSGQRINDSQCGFRAYRMSSIPIQMLKETGFQAESELLIRMGRLGSQFGQTSISTLYGDESSSINPVLDTWKFILLVFQSLLW